MAVSGDQWSDEIIIDDIKPGYDRFMEFDVINIGTNPLRLWKHITNIQTEDGLISEPECTYGRGTWTETEPGNGTCQISYPKNNIDSVIKYDMYTDGEIVWDNEIETAGHVEGGEVIINEDDGIMLNDVAEKYIYIGEIEPGESKHIIQSYHMLETTGNWAQGDILTFDIELLALQLNAPGPIETTLILENKTDIDWDVISGDGRYGILTYKTEDDNFDYTFEGRGLASSTNYSLIYYADPWEGDNPGALLGTMTTDENGDVSTSGVNDIAINLPHPNDDNHPDGAKIWLVTSSDYDSLTNEMTAWNQANYLYEYNLVKYVDMNN